MQITIEIPDDIGVRLTQQIGNLSRPALESFCMFYYKKIFAGTEIYDTEEYYKERIANGLFYILEYEKADLNTEKPGCYELSQHQISFFYSSDFYIIEQAVMRVTSERRSEYSLALNHLLNEIHRICFTLDSSQNKLKDYNAENCITYLRSINVSHEICIGIRNLFDQRNRNKISHSGSKEYAVSEISREIYLKHRNIVANCLATILRWLNR